MNKSNSQPRQPTSNRRSWKYVFRVSQLTIGLSLLCLTLGVGGAFAAFEFDGPGVPQSGISDGSEVSQLQFPAGTSADKAIFVRQNVPSRLITGQTATVSITMRNTGTSTWTRAGGYKLGSQNPQDNKRWTGGTRVYLKPGDSIAPGQSKTFKFDITAPMKPGIYDFQWRMVRENVRWFGAYTRNIPIRVKAPQDRSMFISQSVPTSMQPGETKSVSITMRNNGTTTWTRSDGYKLGSQNPRDNKRWTGRTRIYLRPGDSIAPGQSKTFKFDIKAPMTPGVYNFQWRMVHEGVQWFGQYTPNVAIRVKAPQDRAKFISQTAPTSMDPGQTLSVSITMRNNGTTTWTRAGGYKLGSQNPQDNKDWTGGTRIYLKPADSIAPGQSKTFTFDITAPMDPGIHDFQWRMVHEHVQWFGDYTENVPIEVGMVPSETPTPTPIGFPFPIRPGLWPASNEETSSSDLDGDGLSQKFELQLAQNFFPTIWYDNGEDCTAPGGAPGYPPNRPGRLIFRVRPHPDNPTYISMTYSLLYRDDCGGFMGADGHKGDVEPFAIILAPNPACNLGYGAYALTTWAHYGTIGRVTRTRHLSNLCQFGFSRDPVGHHDVVMVSENKHGNYISDSSCDRANMGAENCDFDFTLGNINAWVGFNVGEEWVGQQRHHNLGPLGFPGERLWEGKKFCGSSHRSWLMGCPGPAEDKMKLIALRDVPLAYAAKFISQSGVPTLMRTGEKAMVSITMKNTGSVPWTRLDRYRLGSLNPADNTVWTGRSRIYLEPSEVIHSGKRKTFSFEITAPSTPGIYNFQWRMIHEGVRWFGEITPNVVILVTDSGSPTPSANDSKFVSQSVPSKLEVGATAAVSITLQNIGTSTWTRGTGYKLGSQNPQDNTIWTGDTRVQLVPTDAILPGQIKTFTFSITAPDVPGQYNFQWRMLKESGAWFGEFSPNIVIDVRDGTIPSDTPEVTPTPTPITSTPTPPTATKTPTPIPSSRVWEDDDFDFLSRGALNGQNGWTTGDASAQVIAFSGRGNVALLDPQAGTISMGKNIPDQGSGRHSFDFDVRVTGAVEASLAKIELQTTPNAGWNKKFQLYFGSSMRINYSSSGAAVSIVPSTQMGRWYHIRTEMDLDSERVDVWVDGVLVASGIPMHTGPIVSLGLSAWDRAGAVFLDNLLGVGEDSSLFVDITAPNQGATVSGIVDVETDVSSDVTRVEFYVDGVLQDSDMLLPYKFAWDTRQNPLPIPNHVLDFGYYFVEWKNPADFPTARNQVNDYTNLYFASRASYDSGLSTAKWRQLLAQSLQNASAENRHIQLALESETLWDDVLDVAAPYWDHIYRIEIEDEPTLTRSQTEAMIQRLKTELNSRGLPHRPMGFVYVYTHPLPDAVNAPSLDWVGIEAYLDFPGSPVSQVNIDALNTFLESAKAQVPVGKQIVLVMMAYDRNFNWTNIDTLRDLQIPTYLQAFNDPRVISLNMFSYTRAGGSRDHPELKTPHRLIGERILGVSLPAAGNGPRTISVRAYDDVGRSVMDTITVDVENSTFPTSTPTPTPSPTAFQPPSPTPSTTPSHTPTPTSGIPSSTPTPTAWIPSSTPSATAIPSSTRTPTPTKIVPTSTHTSTWTPTPIPLIWENDDFDGLALGALHGQNGWYKVASNRASAVVVAEGSGKILQIDPAPGQTIIMGKDVPDQSNAKHVFSFRVKVTGASEASLAKIEVQTAQYTGWTKKFQIYFGSSMRVNYSPSGGAVLIVPTTVMGRWYDVRCEIDFDTGLLNVWVDGSLAVAGISMHPGPIISLSVSGWDRAGRVWLDDLLGFK